MSFDSSEFQPIETILLNLKKGYIMTKHSLNTSIPHNKFVYLSEDNKHLCWKSFDKSDEKRIEVKTISKVVKEGAEPYFKGMKVTDLSRCLVVVSTVRHLHLEAINEVEADIFQHEFSRVIKYSQGIRLNYKYHNQ